MDTSDSNTKKEKFTTITLDSSSKNTIRIILNIVIIIILIVLIVYAIVGTYIFYDKYISHGATPVITIASDAVSNTSAAATEAMANVANSTTSAMENAVDTAQETVAKFQQIMGGLYLKNR
jgi:flagellar basal body-associated protein FliL